MAEVKGINHLALVVKNLEEALEFWQHTIGLELEKTEEIPSEGARVAFMPIGNSRIELVEPTEVDTGLARFMAKRGPGIHHLCLEVEDLKGTLHHLEDHGVELINQEPVKGSDGRMYAFLHPNSTHGVLLELYQLP